MITIDANCNIFMTRGDTLAETVTLYKDGEEYTPSNGDEIIFAMSKFPKGHPLYSAVVSKTIDHSTMLLLIESGDTANLPYGTYYYDMQITYALSGYVETFANGKTIKLIKEYA